MSENIPDYVFTKEEEAEMTLQQSTLNLKKFSQHYIYFPENMLLPDFTPCYFTSSSVFSVSVGTSIHPFCRSI